MPGLNMMRDMDVSDPWARDLEKSLGKPVERAIPMPDCLKRLEEKRIADERFEKMVDAVVEKPAAKYTWLDVEMKLRTAGFSYPEITACCERLKACYPDAVGAMYRVCGFLRTRRSA